MESNMVFFRGSIGLTGKTPPLNRSQTAGIEELGSRFLRPREVQHALCSVAVQLGHLQREHEMLGPKGNREQVFFRGILDIV